MSKFCKATQNKSSLIHISLASFFGTSTNSAKPDQTLHFAVSYQVFHCLLTGCTFKILTILKLITQTTLIFEMDLSSFIMVGNSIRHKWVKKAIFLHLTLSILGKFSCLCCRRANFFKNFLVKP